MGLFALATIFLLLKSWVLFALALVIAFGVYVSLGPEAVRRLRMLGPLLPLIAIVFLLQWHATDPAQAFVSAARLLLMIMIADLVTMTTPVQAMLDAMQPVFRPLERAGVNSRKLALAVALVIRFIPVLFALWSRRREAWLARTARRPSFMLVGLFAADSMRTADRVAEALDARGYGRSRR